MNKKLIMGIVGAFVAGIVLTGAIVYQSAPSMMMIEDESPHGFETTVERFEEAVVAGGWSVVTVHDMQEVLAGHGHDVDGIRIYELCSSKYSAEILALDDERIVSPLMPCRVSIYEKSNGNAYIGRMNSELMARPFGGVISDVMQTAAVETEEVIANVLSDSPVRAADAR